MCLADPKYKGVFEEFVAWKIIVEDPIHPSRFYTGPFSRTTIKWGEWMKARYQPDGKAWVSKQVIGFCVFRGKHEAVSWNIDDESWNSIARWGKPGIVVPVLCKGRVTTGKIGWEATLYDAAYVQYIKFSLSSLHDVHMRIENEGSRHENHES